MKKGDTYCTMWTTGFAGPFTYDGETTFNPRNIIEGTEASLLLAQKGYVIMYQHNVEGEYDFVKRVQEFVSPESIDERIDNLPDNVLELKELKKYSKQIQKVIGGG